jgi:hypothetical protein
MKKFIMALVLVAAFASTPLMAQINGTQEINFLSRTSPNELGIADLYKTDLNVANAFAVSGTIQHLPTILSGTLGRELQSGKLMYDLSFKVFNPANINQFVTPGKLIGAVPITKEGAYMYQQGNLRVAIDAKGSAAGFNSSYQGVIQGLPVDDNSTFGAAAKSAKKITKTVNGKSKTILVTKYDYMRFNGLILPAGPVKKYAEASVSGAMLFDYERSAWYFEGLMIGSNKITGNIKWVPSPQRASNGEGYYELDIRVDEPETAKGNDEAAMFASADDEAAFFAVDTSIPSMTGTINYKDTMSGDTVLSSKVTWALTANSISVAQQVNILKLLLTTIVPFNAE